MNELLTTIINDTITWTIVWSVVVFFFNGAKRSVIGNVAVVLSVFVPLLIAVTVMNVISLIVPSLIGMIVGIIVAVVLFRTCNSYCEYWLKNKGHD